jgi:hypothetical protein
MPIYEYYCPKNHTIYQFYAKTLAQGATVPRCPANPDFPMRRMVSSFAVTKGGSKGEGEAAAADPQAHAGSADEARMEAAMGAMEREFSNIDENDPRAMGRMMRRMAELTGEKIEGEMEEVVRKLEEGADPDSLEDQFGEEGGGESDPYGDPGGEQPGSEPKEARHRFRARSRPPRRDPRLYDYE